MEAMKTAHARAMGNLPAEKAAWHCEEALRLTASARALATTPPPLPATLPPPSPSHQPRPHLNPSPPSTPDLRTQLLEEAVNHCRRGITLEPRNLPLYEAAADAYEALLDSASAVSHLRYALSVAGGGDAVARRLSALLYARARGWLASGSVVAAVDDLTEATALHPKDPKPWLLLAMARVRMLPSPAATAAAHAAAVATKTSRAGTSIASRSSTAGDGGAGGGGAPGSRPGSPGAAAGTAVGAEAALAKEARAHVTAALACVDTAVTLATATSADTAVSSGGGGGSADLCQALVLRAKLLWASDQAEAGNRDFRAATKLDPGHPEVRVFEGMMTRKAAKMYGLAKEAMQRRDLAEATAQLSAAVRVTPDDVRLYMLRASALRQAGHFGDALADLEAAATRSFVARHGYRPPHRPDGWGGGDESDESTAGSKTRSPASPRAAARARGAAGGSGGDGADPAGAAQLRAAMEAQPVWAREPWEVTRQRNLVFNDLGLALIVAGRHAEALELLDRAIGSEAELAMGPHGGGGASSGGHGAVSEGVDVRFLVNRGDCYRALGRLDEARSDFSRAHAADPSNWDTATRLSVVLYSLGAGLLNGGRLEEAEAQLSAAVGLNPKVAAYYDARATARYALHDFSGAHGDWQRALVLDPSLAHVEARLGHTFEPSSNGRANGGLSRGDGKATMRVVAARVKGAEVSAALAASGGHGLEALGLSKPALLGYGGQQQGQQQGQQHGQQRGELVAGGASDAAAVATAVVGRSLLVAEPPPPARMPCGPAAAASAASAKLRVLESGGEARRVGGALASIRHTPTSLKQDCALWKLLKGGASPGGDALGPKGGPSRAVKPGADAVAFLWGSTKRIQQLEDAKRADSAHARLAFARAQAATQRAAARVPDDGGDRKVRATARAAARSASNAEPPLSPAQGGGVAAARSVRSQARE